MDKYCDFYGAGNDFNNNWDDKIVFTIKDTKLFVPIVTLLTKENQTLTKLLNKFSSL